MKNFYVITTCLSLLLTCLILPGAQSQSLVIGTVKNGNPILSSLTNATFVLKSGLNPGVSITDATVALNPETGKYLLLGIVEHGDISAKIVELELSGSTLRAVPGGPGIEITCHGVNCSECYPKVTGWKAKCQCNDKPLKPNAQCDMTSKLILTGW